MQSKLCVYCRHPNKTIQANIINIHCWIYFKHSLWEINTKHFWEISATENNVSFDWSRNPQSVCYKLMRIFVSTGFVHILCSSLWFINCSINTVVIYVSVSTKIQLNIPSKLVIRFFPITWSSIWPTLLTNIQVFSHSHLACITAH